MLILTGCRRDEARRAPWSEIGLGARERLIQGRRTKNGRDQLVPIIDQLAWILEELPPIHGAGLLFTTTGETAISGMAKYKRRLPEAMKEEPGREVAQWTLHDLSRTFFTDLQRLRFPLEVAEACIKHRSGTLQVSPVHMLGTPTRRRSGRLLMRGLNT